MKLKSIFDVRATGLKLGGIGVGKLYLISCCQKIVITPPRQIKRKTIAVVIRIIDFIACMAIGKTISHLRWSNFYGYCAIRH
jgi:hypothetical protein